MRRFLLFRILASALTLLLASLAVFLMVRAVPGSIVETMMGQMGSTEGEAALRRFFGLDQPVYMQYIDWLSRVLTGDFGVSWRQGSPVLSLVFGAFIVSLQLALMVLVVSSLIGVPLGLLAGYLAGGVIDTIIQSFNVLFLATPVFWLALMLLFGVSALFHWSPPTIYASPGRSLSDNIVILLLPMLSLAFLQIAAYAQFVRQHVVEAMQQEYVRALKARGVPPKVILGKHVLRNILVPLITFMGLIFIQILGGVVVIESIFGLPGLGRLLVNALYARDFPVVQGALAMILVSAILINLLVDVLYHAIDPRLRT
ncbi:ABC transporter permease [Pseudohoeflea coraliihabitans]|uniref:ABC transporter permease n=1 Tax=Pseudohoeflea coraliihabitans TaxID=2860393 RepID=A0ABS6WJ85_9HYPH|nr:ABC transporter permease [Pseudohoeflea sp. DP4N28-3]MBW3096009.1 ABC transporter permease [Pseudohoeflea sp. DP4N28-3]